MENVTNNDHDVSVEQTSDAYNNQAKFGNQHLLGNGLIRSKTRFDNVRGSLKIKRNEKELIEKKNE